jgi:HSP20 family protein
MIDMSLQIWNPFRDFSEITSLSFPNRIFSPLTDIRETDNEIIVETNLPGIKQEELKIKATPEGVIIRAEVNGKKEHKEKGKLIRKERYARRYVRRIGFPVPVKAEEAKTTLRDGVLTLSFPKEEKYKPVELIPEAN